MAIGACRQSANGCKLRRPVSGTTPTTLDTAQVHAQAGERGVAGLLQQEYQRMLQATDDPRRRHTGATRLLLQPTSYDVQDTFMRFRRPPRRSAVETKPTHGPEEMRLIYDLVQHEDEMFYQRSNLFLVAESMVLVAYSLLASRAGESPVRGEIIASFGLIVSLIWAWASHRALVILRYVTIRAMKEHSYYRRIREERPNQRWRFMGSTKLMAYAVPAVAIIMWTVLLFT
jgi:hypothetical protein